MLEVVNTSSGHKSFQFNGRLLSSRVNPYKEAQKIIGEKIEAYQAAQSIIVLGVGNPYVLLQLLEIFPQKNIICVEVFSELINAFISEFSSKFENLVFVHYEGLNDLLNQYELREALSKSYEIVKQTSSFSVATSKYMSLLEWLSGRNSESLKKIVFEKTGSTVNLSLINESELINKVTTIKDLHQFVIEKKIKLSPRMFAALQVLRELVV